MSLKITEIVKKTIRSFINENEIINQVWYHGSNKPVEKFLFSLIGKDSGRITNYHGYGIYFIDNIERAKKYGNIITSVKIDQNSDILINKVTLEQLNKIYKQLISEGFDAEDFNITTYNNSAYGEYGILNDIEEFYDFITRRFKFNDIKQTTEFLLRSGIDGMKITNDVGDNILVMFNESKINIISTP